MLEHNTNDSLLEMFLFETSQLIEQLEQSILTSDEENCYTEAAINEIFRIMHTIKGSAAMMKFHDISNLAHTIEDIFFFLREEKPKQYKCGTLSDLILESVDFIKVEIMKIKNNDKLDGNAADLIETLKRFLNDIKMNISNTQVLEKQENKTYKAVIFFEEGCEMENIRAYTIIHKLKDITDCYAFYPKDIIDSDKSIDVIRQEGFQIYLKTNHSIEDIRSFFAQTIYLKDLELLEVDESVCHNYFTSIDCISNNETLSNETSSLNDNSANSINTADENISDTSKTKIEKYTSSTKQSIISVSVDKLDKLMDLVGEMVIAEAMVLQNPDLKGLELNNFEKAARQLSKITSEIQDTIMDVRMLPGVSI